MINPFWDLGHLDSSNKIALLTMMFVEGIQASRNWPCVGSNHSVLCTESISNKGGSCASNRDRCGCKEDVLSR